MKFVYIKWYDAQSVDSWTIESEVTPSLAEIVSVGILVKKTKDIVTVAVNKDTTNNAYSCIMNIPSKWISEYKLLTKRK